MEIIEGTTPTLIFTFDTVSAEDISVAYLLIKQRGNVVVQKTIEDALVSDGKLMFTLTQADTLALTVVFPATVVLDWKTASGVRGRSNVYECKVLPAGVNEVI